MSDLVDLLMKSLEANPSDWNVRKAIIEKMQEEGNYAGCIEIVRSAPGSPPDGQTAVQFAEIVRAVDPACALRLVEGGLITDPSSGPLHLMKANLHLDVGQVNEAGTHYAVAKTIDGTLASPEFEQRLGVSTAAMTSAGAAGVVAAEPQVVQAVEQVAQPEATYAEPEVYEEPVMQVEPVEQIIEEPAHDPIPVSELPVLSPLVDPATIPDAHKLHVENAGDAHSPAMNFTPSEELAQTRAHLAVFDGSGSAIDADVLSDDAWYEDEEPTLLSAGAGVAPMAAERDETKEKVGAILTTILVHIGIALILWAVVIAIPAEKPPEITATTISDRVNERVVKKQLPRQVQQKPSAPSQNIAQIVTAATTATISAPTVDFNVESEVVDLGTSMGFGMGFGTGGSGSGGSFSFMGNSGTGKRVVFAVDYSASMRSQQREALMKEELSKSVARLPKGSQYQVLFFSAFAWPHDAVKDEWLKNKGDWGPRNGNLLNKMRPFGSSGRLQKDAADLKIPDYKYLTASNENISRSRKIIEEMPLTYGTNWEHPVIMALRIKPKPDIIFFMTDGAVGNPQRAIEAITELNKKGKPTVINTTAMMEPRAAKELGQLADKNGGKFTIVLEGGKIVKGEDFLKGKKK